MRITTIMNNYRLVYAFSEEKRIVTSYSMVKKGKKVKF